MSTKRGVNIGTCGFRLARADYFRQFTCVEIQHTFYQPPRAATIEGWRRDAPEGFEFTLKAWQLITHDAKSPTYKRLKRGLTESEKSDAGYFKATAVVREAWDVTLACAKALGAKVALFQCPASFKQTKENIARLEKFFPEVKREGLNFAWEPRGEWDAQVVRGICEGMKLWHATDPFVGRSATPDRCYFRLHGRRGWRYEYGEDELSELAAMLPRGGRRGGGYVFFNNVRMTEDARKFRDIVSGVGD